MGIDNSESRPHAEPCDQWAKAIVTVVAVNGPTATVESAGAGACGKCSNRSGCGAKTLLSMFGKRAEPLRIKNSVNASVGDQVEIGIDQGMILKLSAISYLMPLAGLMVGGVFAGIAHLGEGPSFISGVAGLICGFLYSRHLYSSDRWEQRISPTCLRRVSSSRPRCGGGQLRD